jgi:oligoribonuclease NrnB/cAMP/cGMP phosphodiesterase (DHH superfamily)
LKDWLIISHVDLDGIGAAAVAEALLRSRGISPAVTFSDIKSAGEKALDAAEMGIRPFILDLHVEKNALDAILEAGKKSGIFDGAWDIPLVVDHHRESMAYENEPWAVVSTDYSAALLAAKWAEEQGGLVPSDELRELARLADDYDMWRHTDPACRRLNAVVTVLQPDGAFRWLQERGWAYEHPMVERYLDRQRTRLDLARSGARMHRDPGGTATLCVVSPSERIGASDVNELADVLLREGNDCVVYIYPHAEKGPLRMSIRSRNGEAAKLVARMAPYGVKGGGHENACGASGNYKLSTVDDLIKNAIVPAFNAFCLEERERNTLETMSLDFGI